MQTLTIPTGPEDRKARFVAMIPGYRGRLRPSTCYLLQDTKQGTLFLMQESACIKDSYTAEDLQERVRLNQMTPVKHGDVVTVDGAQYRVTILGDYSDAGRLTAV